MSESVYYLDCSFSEKDRAKALGARWSTQEGKWYVPSKLEIQQFSRWHPRMYLDCPFDEKDEAKKIGARWDAQAKRWYMTHKQSMSKFSKWLMLKPPKEGKTKGSSSSKSKAVRRGNAQDATLLRISESMTVSQLQEECRFRQIRGLSGTNKEWLLDQLGDGSVWQTQSSASKPASTNERPRPALGLSKPKPKPKPSGIANTPIRKTDSKVPSKNAKYVSTKTAQREIANTKTKAKVAKAITKKTDSKSPEKPPKAKSTPPPQQKAKPAFVAPTTGIDWTRLPHATDSLTIAQLSHELMFRQPQIKGMSNKPKAWFLSLLGESSIWTTSPDVMGLPERSRMPLVSKSMTVPQLVHEIMTRAPTIKGLSSKSKDGLLNIVGVGSIWTTARTMESASASPKKVLPLTKKSKATAAKKESSPKRNDDDVGAGDDVSKSAKKRASALQKQAPARKSAIAQITATTKRPAKKAPTEESAPKRVKKESGPLLSSSAQLKVAPKKNAAATSAPIVPTQVKSSTANAKIAATAAAQKPTQRPIKVELEAALRAKLVKSEPIPLVSSAMTVVQLKEEARTRDPKVKGLSAKGKTFLLLHLGEGTEREGSVEYIEKMDSKASNLHAFDHVCHMHPLADSSILRATKRHSFYSSQKRVHLAVCDIDHLYFCAKKAYRTCERCDYDICKECLRLESLPAHKKHQEIDRRELQEAEKEAASIRRWQENKEREEREHQERTTRFEKARQQHREEYHGDDLARFPTCVRDPSVKSKDASNKLKYTVWIRDVHRKESGCDVAKEFDSSFDCLEDANLRVEYVLYYDNPLECDKDDMFVDSDEMLSGGLRMMRHNPDGGGSLTVSVLPSDVFKILEPQRDTSDSYCTFFDQERPPIPDPRGEASFAKAIRSPSAKQMNESKKLGYTVWTSCGYGYDGWHSYEGLADKKFDSSYASLEQANDRVEYVFYYKNPWGISVDEMGNAETDQTSKGVRLLSCQPDDSECWTVSVIPSIAFNYINL